MSDDLGRELNYLTGMEFDHPQAKATLLLHDMRVRPSGDEFNTDELIGRRFKIRVRHRPSKKDPTKTVAEIAYLEPLDGDPFE